MAMLAEPRRKQRIGPNPRGKFFTDDEDNRGRQMLMKMGWKTGDGLGASSQGMNEPIKPKVHTDARGLGYDRKHDPWVAHNEEFEQLLKSLNNTDEETVSKPRSGDDDDSAKGLEKKSKGSRSRIHYHKFVKNKDLSRASTKDMSCIFGKALDETAAIYSALNAEVTSEDQPEESSELKNSLETGQVSDSDEKPKKKKKKKRSKETDSAEEEATTKMGNDCDSKEENNIEPEQSLSEELIPTTEESEIKKKKKKKRKHKDIELAIEVEENIESEQQQNDDSIQIDNNTIECAEEIVEKDSKKKKKKSKKRKRSSSEAEEEVVPDDVTESITETQELITHEKSENEETPPVKKKKKKRKHDTDSVQEPTIEPAEGTAQSEDVSSVNEIKNNTTTVNDKVEKFGCLQFINRGSIVDYFRSKMLSKGLSSSVNM